MHRIIIRVSVQHSASITFRLGFCDASGLSAKTVTRVTHLSSTESKTTIIPLTRILISSRANVAFLHTIGACEIHDSLPTVSHYIYSHLYLRWMRRQATRKNFARQMHCHALDKGKFPQIKSHSRYKLKHEQIHKLVLSALDNSFVTLALECQRLVLDAPRLSMQPILGFLLGPDGGINAVPVPLTQCPCCSADICQRLE